MPILSLAHGQPSVQMMRDLEHRLLLARDLRLIKPKDHTELVQRAAELKRTLTALIQKLTAES